MANKIQFSCSCKYLHVDVFVGNHLQNNVPLGVQIESGKGTIHPIHCVFAKSISCIPRELGGVIPVHCKHILYI